MRDFGRTEQCEFNRFNQEVIKKILREASAGRMADVFFCSYDEGVFFCDKNKDYLTCQILSVSKNGIKVRLFAGKCVDIKFSKIYILSIYEIKDVVCEFIELQGWKNKITPVIGDLISSM